MSMSTLAGRLAAALADVPDVTNAELARVARVKPSSVSDWLSGESKAIKAEPLLRVAARLGVHPLWLCSGEGPRHNTVAAESPNATRWPFKKVHAEDLTALPPAALETAERLLRAYLGKPTAIEATSAPAPQRPGLDWRNLAKQIAGANPDDRDRHKLLHFIDVVDAKARQIAHNNSQAPSTVKNHIE